VAKRLGLYIYLFMPTGHALGKFEASDGQISDRKDPGLNKNGCRGGSDIREGSDQHKNQRQANHRHHDVDPGIDMRLAANQKELNAKRIGTDKKHGDQQEPERQHGFRIIPTTDPLDDFMRKNKDQRQTDQRNIHGDLLYLPHKIKRPGLAAVEDLAQPRKKRLGKGRQRKCLAKTRDFFRHGIKSHQGIVGEQPERKNTRCRVSVNRDVGNKNVPTGRQLLAQTGISREPE